MFLDHENINKLSCNYQKLQRVSVLVTYISYMQHSIMFILMYESKNKTCAKEKSGHQFKTIILSIYF